MPDSVSQYLWWQEKKSAKEREREVRVKEAAVSNLQGPRHQENLKLQSLLAQRGLKVHQVNWGTPHSFAYLYHVHFSSVLISLSSLLAWLTSLSHETPLSWCWWWWWFWWLMLMGCVRTRVSVCVCVSVHAYVCVLCVCGLWNYEFFHHPCMFSHTVIMSPVWGFAAAFLWVIALFVIVLQVFVWIF